MEWKATEGGVEVTNAGVTVIFGLDELGRFEKEIDELRKESKRLAKVAKYKEGAIWLVRATQEEVSIVSLTDSGTRIAWRTADGRIWSEELGEFENLFKPKGE